MNDILEEVLRDQSDEKKVLFFRKILPIVIFLTIAIVIGMVINNWYRDDVMKKNMQRGDILIKAVNNTDKKLVDETLNNLIKSSDDSNISELASLKKVGIKITEGNFEQAKVLLEEIINNKNYESLTSSFARVSWLSLVIEQATLSAKEKAQFEEYLKYYHNENQEFFGTASLLKAMWYMRAGQNDLAKEVLRNITSIENLPLSIKEQAKALLSKLNIIN
jgi:hypothetical protein